MKRNILYAVDILRIVSFAAIAMFHAYSSIFYIDYLPAVWRGNLFSYTQMFPRVFSFSGFTIVALFAFLAGAKARVPRFKRRFVIAAVGALVLLFAYSNLWDADFFWEWDIYQYLFCTFLSLFWIARKPARIYTAGIAGFLLTWLPLWNWLPLTDGPLVIRHALVGVCGGGRGGWPLLPWLGLPWFFYAFGYVLAQKGWQTLFLRGEKWLWFVALGSGLPQWGIYYHVDISSAFYCYMFRQAPYVFWSHFVWVAFILRVAAFPGLQEFLGRFSLCRALSRLYLNRYFGLAYLVQLLWIWAGMALAVYIRESKLLFNIYYLSVLPLTELSLRSAFLLKEKAYARRAGGNPPKV